jgi:glycosyltransferase involved in cell wall biosynthesis
MNLSDRVVQYTATEGELNFLYEHAQALVFPSLYEGFGFPIIEAMRAGCPLLLANASCFPEIAKDAARYFDPQDVRSLTSLLVETLEGSFNRQNYASAANRILPGFNIEKSVNHTLELYAKVCS